LYGYTYILYSVPHIPACDGRNINNVEK